MRLATAQPWIAHYPKNMPADISIAPYQSLAEFMREQCKKYSDQVAFENFDSTLTYAELDQMSGYFAAYLQHKLHLRKGDRFGIMLPNMLQFPIALLAALRIGLVVVNINPLYTPDELIHQIKDAGMSALIVMENFASVVEQARKKVALEHVIVTKMGDCLSGMKGPLINLYLKYIRKDIPSWTMNDVYWFLDILSDAKQHDMQCSEVDITPDDCAMLQYTGGTTGVAKGAMLSNRNVLSNIIQCYTWVEGRLAGGDNVVVTALPLYHIFSLTGCFFFMYAGCRSLLITNPRDMNFFVRFLMKKKFSIFVGINTLFNGLLQQKQFSSVDFSHLKLVISGGMALQETVANQWQSQTGSVIVEGYGLTEASPVVTINAMTVERFTGSVGYPVPSTSISIRDEQDDEVAIGAVGELWVKGPQVMQGYWQRPEETRKVIQNGWLKTGDIARVDEKGRVFIVDRRKDMIIVSGFNVYPNEIEAVIMAHPKVAEVAVVGIPCSQSGEAVKAFITPRDADLTSDDIITFCRQKLTNYKIPKVIEFAKELPKSNVGKVLRRALRE